MIWYDCNLEVAVTEKDELDNDVNTGAFTVLSTTQARTSPFTAEELAEDRRRLTRNQQRYILPLPFSDVKPATHAVINNLRQVIVDKTKLDPRWSVITVEAYKV
jgi:hypothetical protein